MTGLQAFMDCLDAFGADAARWPQDRRGAFEALASRSQDARRMLAEAKALDAVLQRGEHAAPAARLARIEDLIVTAAVSERAAAVGSSGGNVVPMRAPVRQPSPSAPAAAPHTPHRPASRTTWRSAGLLAASLFAGIIIGFSEPGQSTMSGLMSAVSASSTWDGNDIASAIQGETLDALEEVL
jgi:hypothetical protein